MADQFVRCEKFTLAGVDLSDKVLSVPTPTEMVEVRDTTVARAKARTRGGYLRNNSFSVVLRQDFSAAKTHATIQENIGNTVKVRFQYLPTSGTGGVPTGAMNPIWDFSVIISRYTAGSGATGDVHRVACNWEVSGEVELLLVEPTSDPGTPDVDGWPA